jgi:cell division protein ZapA
MSQVNVTINGRQFRMACEDGQEAHLTELAQQLDGRIEGLRTKFGEIGDTRLTVMAAITMADELTEMAQRLRHLEEDLAAIKGVQEATADRGRSSATALATALTSAAERIEVITKKLNKTIGGSSVALG